MSKPKPALIIFVKNPELGKVKTRLASTVGDQMALKIYLSLLGHTRRLATVIDAERYLFYSNHIDLNDQWPNEHFHKHLQVNGDLGMRMQDAFQKVLNRHSQALIIGSDCASLTSAILQQAFQHLETADYVLGPAIDGGYYALGMKQLLPGFFQKMQWSTESVAQATQERIQAAGKECALLPTLSDIDYEEDWLQYGWDLEPS